MSLFVIAVGVFITVMAGLFVVMPARMRAFMRGFISSRQLHLAAMIRIIIGMIFILQAPDSDQPTLLMLLGLLFMLAGVMIPVLGVKRVHWLSSWWLEKPESVLRGWGVLAFVFGSIVIWTGL